MRTLVTALVLSVSAASAERAPPVKSDAVIVDHIKVTHGSLRDGGAGVSRWAHRTLEGCVEAKSVKRGRGTMRVAAGGAPNADPTVAVAGPRDLADCLRTRLSSLVWSDDVETVVVQARVVVRR